MIQYAKISSNRNKQFRIVTTIETIDGNTFVRKKALGTAADQYIEHLGHNYDVMKSKSGDVPFRFANSMIKNRTFISEYLPFPSLDSEFRHHIDNGDLKQAHTLLDTVIKHIAQLPQYPKDPDELARKRYQSVFDATFHKSTRFIDFGYLDFNLDNILRDGDGTLYLIDYEWVFDFPLPQELIIGRMLYYTFIRLGLDDLSKLDVITLDSGLTLPKKSYDTYKKHFSYLPEVIKADTAFQQYVGSDEDKEISAESQRSNFEGNSSFEHKLRVYNKRVIELEKELRKQGDINSELQTHNNALTSKVQHLERMVAHLEQRLPRLAYRKLKNFLARLFA